MGDEDLGASLNQALSPPAVPIFSDRDTNSPLEKPAKTRLWMQAKGLYRKSLANASWMALKEILPGLFGELACCLARCVRGGLPA